MCLEDYEKPMNALKKKVCSVNLKNKSSDDNEIKRTKEMIKLFNNKNEEEQKNNRKE